MISLCGAGGVCEAINQNWLAACRIKDQLQPKSPPRRMFNPLSVLLRFGIVRV